MNHFMVLHIHRKLIDKLDLVKTGYTFISGNDHRHQVSGAFKYSDISKYFFLLACNRNVTSHTFEAVYCFWV